MAAICAAYASIPPPFLASSFVVATEGAAAAEAAWRVAAPADHLNANASDDRQLFERRRRRGRRGTRGRRRVGGAALCKMSPASHFFLFEKGEKIISEICSQLL